MNRNQSRLAAPTNFNLFTHVQTTERPPRLKPPTRVSLPDKVKPVRGLFTTNYDSPRPQGLSLPLGEPAQHHPVLSDERYSTPRVTAMINNETPVLFRENHTLPKTLIEVLEPSDTLLSYRMIDDIMPNDPLDKHSEQEEARGVTPPIPSGNIVSQKPAELIPQDIPVEETLVIEHFDMPTDDQCNDDGLEDYDQLPQLNHGIVIPSTSELVFEHSHIQIKPPSHRPSLLRPSVFKSIERRIQPQTLRFCVDLLNPHSDWILERE